MGPSLKNAHKFRALILNLVISLISVGVINFILINFSVFWKQLLLGKNSLSEGLTFQDTMWLMFVIGLIEVVKRRKEIVDLEKFQRISYLPEKFEDLIDDNSLTQVIKTAKEDASKERGILPYMILQIALQYRTNFSIALISDFLTKQIEIFLHQTELKFNQLKYIVWLIPSIGFMGTVYGIGLAVTKLGEGKLDDPELLVSMAKSLGIAFNTTLLALVMSVALQFLMQYFEAREERVINRYGKYILDNLINKIVEKR